MIVVNLPGTLSFILTFNQRQSPRCITHILILSNIKNYIYLAIFVSKLSDGGVQPVLSQCSVRPELVSSGIPLTSLRQSQPSMRFECVVVVVAASPRYLNFPPIFVFYERDSLTLVRCSAGLQPIRVQTPTR